MTDRIPLAEHSKASLDALYSDLDRYEEAVGELNEANIGLQRQAAHAETERDQAQAALERVRRLAQYARDRTEAGESDWAIGQHELACAVLDTLDSPAETEPPAP